MEQQNYKSIAKHHQSRSLDAAAQVLNVEPVFCHYYTTATGIYALSRWRYFVGSYTLPPLPSPYLVAHLGGKPFYRVSANKDLVSTEHSMPGNLFTVAGGEQSTWMINGEVDVFVLSAADLLGEESNTPEQSSSIWHLPLFRKHRLGINDQLTSALLRQLLNHIESGEQTADDYVKTLLEMLELHLTRVDIRPNSREPLVANDISSAKRISTAIEYIGENLQEELSINTLSSIAGINPLYFSELFKQYQGVTPQRFILQKRVNRARELLATTDLSIAIISQETGFSSQGHLTTTFSRLMEMTPSEFRKRISSTNKEKDINHPL